MAGRSAEGRRGGRSAEGGGGGEGRTKSSKGGQVGTMAEVVTT